MVPDRYNISNFKTALENPSLIYDELRRLLLESWALKINNLHFRYKYEEPIDVMSKDWDNLCILDACRYDYFVEQNTIEGTLQPVTSCSSNSWGFMENNFVGRNLHDTIYVTANPYAERLSDDVFFRVESVLDQWDDEIGTVQPHEVVNATIEVYEKYPNKRLIAHFMQPHKPWLGPTAERIRGRLNLKGFNKNHVRDDDDPRTGRDAFQALRRGDISSEEMKRAYSESLDIVLKHVGELINELDGKTVVTADHGEMLGEQITLFSKSQYGHGYKVSNDLSVLTPELHIVPWLEIESDYRREITEDDPIEFERLDDEVVNDRLEALGYTS